MTGKVEDMRDFTLEEVRMLAEAERKMDSGEMFYVVLHGNRVSVSDEVAEELGLERGQTINDFLFQAILKAQLAAVQAAIAMQNAAKK